jgi:hypothetical protein
VTVFRATVSSPGLPPSAIGWAVGSLLVASISAWAIGLEWPEALLIGLTAAALLGLRRLPSTNSDEEWPPRADNAGDRGVRRDVTRLSWTLQGYESRVERPSLRRLRAVAVRRLAAQGLDLEQPADAAACRAILGQQAYEVVTADGQTAVRFDTFTQAVTTVENLVELADPATSRRGPAGGPTRR